MGWRMKLVFLLVVFFAGFITGIYCFAPVSDEQRAEVSSKGFISSVLKSDEFAKSLNSGVHKCIDFGKDAVERTGEYLHTKIEDYRKDS